MSSSVTDKAVSPHPTFLTFLFSLTESSPFPQFYCLLSKNKGPPLGLREATQCPAAPVSTQWAWLLHCWGHPTEMQTVVAQG